jgi:hypothetical protein
MSKEEVLNKIREASKKCEKIKDPEKRYFCSLRFKDMADIIERAYRGADLCRLEFLLDDIHFLGWSEGITRRLARREGIDVGETLTNVREELIDDLARILREKCKCH